MSEDTSHNKSVKHLYPKTSGEQNFYAMHKWETPNDKFLDPNNGVFKIATKVFNRKANHYGHDMTDGITAYDQVVTRDSNEFENESVNEGKLYHTLFTHEDGQWAPQFGDYDKNVVRDEAKDSYSHIKGKHKKIISHDSKQATMGHMKALAKTIPMPESEENSFIKNFLDESTSKIQKRMSAKQFQASGSSVNTYTGGNKKKIVKKPPSTQHTLGSLAKNTGLAVAHTAFPNATKIAIAAYNTYKKFKGKKEGVENPIFGKYLKEKAHYTNRKGSGFHHVVALKVPVKKKISGLPVNPHEFLDTPIKEISNSLLARYHKAADANSDHHQDNILRANMVLANGKNRQDKFKTLQDRSNSGFKLAKRTFGMKDAEGKLKARGIDHPDQVTESWKYLQYPSDKHASDARKAHHEWKDDKGMASGNPARFMGKGKIAYRGDFKGPKPVKEGNSTDAGEERLGHVGLDMMAPIQLKKGVIAKMKMTGKPPVKMNPSIKTPGREEFGKGYSADGQLGSFNELSSDLLGRYIKKSSANLGNNAYAAGMKVVSMSKIDQLNATGHTLKARSRKKGIGMATDKLRDLAHDAEMDKKFGRGDTYESVGEMKAKVFRSFNKYRGGKVPGQKKQHFNDSSAPVADLQKKGDQE